MTKAITTIATIAGLAYATRFIVVAGRDARRIARQYNVVSVANRRPA